MLCDIYFVMSTVLIVLLHINDVVSLAPVLKSVIQTMFFVCFVRYVIFSLLCHPFPL